MSMVLGFITETLVGASIATGTVLVLTLAASKFGTWLSSLPKRKTKLFQPFAADYQRPGVGGVEQIQTLTGTYLFPQGYTGFLNTLFSPDDLPEDMGPIRNVLTITDVHIEMSISSPALAPEYGQDPLHVSHYSLEVAVVLNNVIRLFQVLPLYAPPAPYSDAENMEPVAELFFHSPSSVRCIARLRYDRGISGAPIIVGIEIVGFLSDYEETVLIYENRTGFGTHTGRYTMGIGAETAREEQEESWGDGINGNPQILPDVKDSVSSHTRSAYPQCRPAVLGGVNRRIELCRDEAVQEGFGSVKGLAPQSGRKLRLKR